MKRIIAWLSVIFALGVVPMLMGPSGGFPSRPRFQSVGIGTSPSVTDFTISQASSASFPVFQTWCSNGSTSGARCWSLFENASIAGLSLKTTQDNGTLNPGTVFSATRSGANLSDIQFGDTTSNQTTEIRGTGIITLGDAGVTQIKGGAVDMTPLTGTITPAATGCSSPPTTVDTYARMGNLVSIAITSTNCTSNATTYTLAAGSLPSAIRPASNKDVCGGTVNVDNSVTLTTSACARFVTDGSVLFFTGPAEGAWTASGTKNANGVYTYPIN